MQLIENNYKVLIFNPAISIITLNVSGLNTPIKRQRLSGQMRFRNKPL